MSVGRVHMQDVWRDQMASRRTCRGEQVERKVSVQVSLERKWVLTRCAHEQQKKGRLMSSDSSDSAMAFFAWQ